MGYAGYDHLAPGTIVHYHHGLGEYVRAIVVDDDYLRPIALVGASWPDHPSGYFRDMIDQGSTFSPNGANVYEAGMSATSRKRYGDPALMDVVYPPRGGTATTSPSGGMHRWKWRKNPAQRRITLHVWRPPEGGVQRAWEPFDPGEMWMMFGAYGGGWSPFDRPLPVVEERIAKAKAYAEAKGYHVTVVRGPPSGWGEDEPRENPAKSLGEILGIEGSAYMLHIFREDPANFVQRVIDEVLLPHREELVWAAGDTDGRVDYVEIARGIERLYAKQWGPPRENPAHDTTRASRIPWCDICDSRGDKTPAAYDGRTRMGPWANMCEECFEEYGVGLGLGRGQRLVRSRDGGPDQD